MDSTEGAFQLATKTLNIFCLYIPHRWIAVLIDAEVIGVEVIDAEVIDAEVIRAEVTDAKVIGVEVNGKYYSPPSSWRDKIACQKI